MHGTPVCKGVSRYSTNEKTLTLMGTDISKWFNYAMCLHKNYFLYFTCIAGEFMNVYFVCMPGADVGYLHRPVEEGAHVAIVGLVHLLQEAAVLFLRFVTYQTLQHHS